MSAMTKRKKMCWSCEGNVDLDEENCPFCQASFDPPEEDHHSEMEYTPPYRVQDGSSFLTPSKAPFSYKTASEQMALPQDLQEDDVEEQEEAAVDDSKTVIVTMAMLMGGLVFFLFGSILWLFSHDGYLVLRWSDSFWPLYVICGSGMLYFGFRSLVRC